MTFGTFFKNKRMKTDLSLRQFCKSKGLDPAYISRIENDIIPAPNKQSLLETLARALDIKENFPEVLAYLPASLRSVKKNKVTKEDVNELKEEARKFLSSYNPENKVPVNTEHTAEYHLGISIIPTKGPEKLRGLLSPNMTDYVRVLTLSY